MGALPVLCQGGMTEDQIEQLLDIQRDAINTNFALLRGKKKQYVEVQLQDIVDSIREFLNDKPFLSGNHIYFSNNISRCRPNTACYPKISRRGIV
ncbi:hypothetical protein FRC03_011239 [Tulasnella sp. 419]|nr:hypothetical protein FRC03_011239 [Tulasnella sp. 419]